MASVEAWNRASTTILEHYTYVSGMDTCNGDPWVAYAWGDAVQSNQVLGYSGEYSGTYRNCGIGHEYRNYGQFWGSDNGTWDWNAGAWQAQ